MVNIIGNKASLLSTPNTTANEQTNSPKMANASDRLLPTPKGSGKWADICSNPSSFCKPCEANKSANTTRATNKKAAVLQLCYTLGSNMFNTFFIFLFCYPNFLIHRHSTTALPCTCHALHCDAIGGKAAPLPLHFFS